MKKQLPKKHAHQQKPSKTYNNQYEIKRSINYKEIFFILSIIFYVFIIFSPSLKNSFLLWDDNKLITENPYIKDLSIKGIYNIFSAINLHDPLTILTHAITYKFFGLNVFYFHLFNVLLHILNVLLVYFLSKRLFNNVNYALIIAIFFAIHPLKVESIAWASERKDVLFAFFFLLSILTYDNFLKLRRKYLFYTLSLVFMLFSMLSKMAAMVIPVILFLFDYLKGRKISINLFLEKLPYFLFAAIVIFFNLKGLKVDFDNDLLVMPDYSMIDRFVLAFYSLGFYVYKFLVPLKLSAIYPYPDLINSMLPQFYYFMAISVFICIIIILYLVYKFKFYLNKLFVFGVLFFLINISIVLHIIPIKGVVVAADRYTYIALFGLLIAAFSYYIYLDSRCKIELKYKNLIIFFLLFIISFYSYQSYNKCKVWKNTITLFSNVIEHDSNNAFAYWSRASAKAMENDNNSAIEDYSMVVKLKPSNIISYHNRGNLKAKTGDLNGALDDFNTLLKLNPNLAETFVNRGNLKEMLKDNSGALNDYNEAIRLNPNTAFTAYCNRGVLKAKLNNYEDAIVDFNISIKLRPNFVEAILNRGLTFYDLKKFKEAEDDFNKVIDLNPKNWQAYNGRGNVYLKQSKFVEGIEDYNQVIYLNPNYSFAYYNRGNAYHLLNNIDFACRDWRIAYQKGYKLSQNLIIKFCKN